MDKAPAPANGAALHFPAALNPSELYRGETAFG
jgi:hypothetical protein